MPYRFFDVISPLYDILIRGSPSKRILNLFNMNKNSEFRILEVGAGTGRTAEFINTNFNNTDLWLLEPSVPMLGYARKKVPSANFVKGIAEKMCFEDNFFDRVYAVDSFHHWNDHLQGLKEVYRVLKENSHNQ